MAPNVEETEISESTINNKLFSDSGTSIHSTFDEKERENNHKPLKFRVEKCGQHKWRISKIAVALTLYYYLSALYGIYRLIFYAQIYTIFYSTVLVVCGLIGVTAGAHRLWSHRSYTATWPLQLLLLLMFSLASQFSVLFWVRNHRIHHLYSDTDADPHNINRGFIFSHIGWLLVEKHPAAKRAGRAIALDDIYGDPLLAFHQRHSTIWLLTFGFILPTLIPLLVWGESLNDAWHVATILRFMIILNITCLINSAAHKYGNRPYDWHMAATDNWLLTIPACGDAYHNYHHTFPWDYRGAELGTRYINLTTKFIDFFAWIGWAHGLKTVSRDHINVRSERTGDGTRCSLTH